MTTREASLNDVEALAALAIETFTAAFGHSFSPADLSAHLQNNLSLEKFQQYILDDVILLAEDEGKIVGYVQFGATDFLGELELRRLYVHAGYQNQGVGSRLMEAALNHPQMKAAECIVLDVWEHNPGAQRLYARYGFEVAGKRGFEVESGAPTSFDWVMLRQQPKSI